MPWSLGDLLLLLDRTALNPLLTGISIGVALYLEPPQALNFAEVTSRISSSSSLLRIITIFAFGLVVRLNRILSRKALNNGVLATFDWTKEIIVVTGGSSGIGAATARRLATKGSKVVVLDVLPLTFEPGT